MSRQVFARCTSCFQHAYAKHAPLRLNSSITGSPLIQSLAKTEPEKSKGGFNKPLHLSEPLQALLGHAKPLSRPQVVKRIWDHIKQHDLQDPSDKRFILCDEAMRRVFECERVHMFTMNRVLSGQLRAVD